MTKKKLIRHLYDSHNISVTDAKKLWCGKKLGYGSTRIVYEFKLDPNYVVKLDHADVFSNAIEYKVWDSICLADWYSKWFAECLFISYNGRIMIQQKVEFGLRKQYPKKIPSFFTDRKIENFGFVNGQLKCVDYDNVLGMLTGFMNKKMRNANWWSIKKRGPG